MKRAATIPQHQPRILTRLKKCGEPTKRPRVAAETGISNYTTYQDDPSSDSEEYEFQGYASDGNNEDDHLTGQDIIYEPKVSDTDVQGSTRDPVNCSCSVDVNRKLDTLIFLMTDMQTKQATRNAEVTRQLKRICGVLFKPRERRPKKRVKDESIYELPPLEEVPDTIIPELDPQGNTAVYEQNEVTSQPPVYETQLESPPHPPPQRVVKRPPPQPEPADRFIFKSQSVCSSDSSGFPIRTMENLEAMDRRIMQSAEFAARVRQKLFKNVSEIRRLVKDDVLSGFTASKKGLQRANGLPARRIINESPFFMALHDVMGYDHLKSLLMSSKSRLRSNRYRVKKLQLENTEKRGI